MKKECGFLKYLEDIYSLIHKTKKAIDLVASFLK